MQAETRLATLTEDAVKTSAIEGEWVAEAEVRSSLARRLGLSTAGLPEPGRAADAIASLVLDATQNYAAPVDEARLFAWHRMLFPVPDTGRFPIIIGGWRDDAHGPMQVVSGPAGRERVHFEAPGAARVPAEMRRFLEWFETADDSVDPVLKAAVAHIWFVTIHPFDDGNGRIARALADLALARAEATALRCYSMSKALRRERHAYYRTLEEAQSTLEGAQTGDLDITSRLAWFLDVLDGALADAERTLAATLGKAEAWRALGGVVLNDRQRLMLNRLFDGFDGKLTCAKWAQIGKCSVDTALRDIDALIEQGILARGPQGGRSTFYRLRDQSKARDSGSGPALDSQVGVEITAGESGLDVAGADGPVAEVLCLGAFGGIVLE